MYITTLILCGIVLVLDILNKIIRRVRNVK